MDDLNPSNQSQTQNPITNSSPNLNPSPSLDPNPDSNLAVNPDMSPQENQLVDDKINQSASGDSLAANENFDNVDRQQTQSNFPLQENQSLQRQDVKVKSEQFQSSSLNKPVNKSYTSLLIIVALLILVGVVIYYLTRIYL